MNTRSLLLASLIGGVVMGLLSDLPLISIGNCLLCLWVWGSGILAVYLYRRFSQPNPALSIGQGAALGALTGVVGAIVGTIVGAIFSASANAAITTLLSRPEFSQALGNLPLDLLTAGGFSFISLVCNMVVYIAFGALGGILAVAAIWKPPATTTS